MRIRRIIALALALLCFATAALADVYVLTVADPTYIRSKPKIAKNIQAEIASHTVLDWGGQIEIDDRGVAFLDVYYGGNKHGWVSSLHASLWDSETGEVIEMPYVFNSEHPTNVFILKSVNVYDGPGTYYSVVGYLNAGDYAQYTGFSQKDSAGNTWYQLKSGAYQGWVPASCATLV